MYAAFFAVCRTRFNYPAVQNYARVGMHVCGGEEVVTEQEHVRDLAGKMHTPKHEKLSSTIGHVVNLPLISEE